MHLPGPRRVHLRPSATLNAIPLLLLPAEWTVRPSHLSWCEASFTMARKASIPVDLHSLVLTFVTHLSRKVPGGM